MTAEWCVATIEQAIVEYGKPQIINSDQGSQFTSDVYINCLIGHSIQISMDGKGRAIDNIFIERLWRSVKYEDVYLHAYDNGNELFSGLFKYFRFYNRDRPHQSLEYKTPMQCYKTKRLEGEDNFFAPCGGGQKVISRFKPSKVAGNQHHKNNQNHLIK